MRSFIVLALLSAALTGLAVSMVAPVNAQACQATPVNGRMVYICR